MEILDLSYVKQSRPITSKVEPKNPSRESYKPFRGNNDYLKNQLGTVGQNSSVSNQYNQLLNYWDEMNAEKRFNTAKI